MFYDFCIKKNRTTAIKIQASIMFSYPFIGLPIVGYLITRATLASHKLQKLSTIINTTCTKSLFQMSGYCSRRNNHLVAQIPNNPRLPTKSSICLK